MRFKAQNVARSTTFGELTEESDIPAGFSGKAPGNRGNGEKKRKRKGRANKGGSDVGLSGFNGG